MTLVGDPRSGSARSRSGGRESSQARGGDPYGGRGGGGDSGSGGGDKPSWDIEAAVENRVEYLKSKYGGEAEKFLNRENIRRKLEEAHSSGVYKSTGQVESSYQGSPVSRIEAAEQREFREATHRVFEIRSNVGDEPSRQELEKYRGGLGEDVYRRELRGIEKQDLAEQYSRQPFVYNEKKYFGEAAGEKILQLQEAGKYQDYLKRQELERQKRERDQMLYENRMREFGRRRERFLTETGLKIGVNGFNVTGVVPKSEPESVESKNDSRRVVKMGMVPEIPEGVRDRVGVAASNYFSKLKGKKTFLGAKLTFVKDVLELPGDVAQEGLEFFERKIEPKIKPYVPAVGLSESTQKKIVKAGKFLGLDRSRDELKTQGLILGYSMGVGLPLSSLPAAASYAGRFGVSYLSAVGAQKGIKRLPLEKLPGGQTTEDVLALGGGILAGGVVMGASGALERKLANALKSPRVSQQISQVNLVSGDRTAGAFTGTRRVSDFYGTRNLGKVMGSFKEKPGVGVLRYATQGKGSLGTTRSSVGKMVYGFSDDVRNLRPSGLGVGGKAPVPAGKFIKVPSSGFGRTTGFKLPTNYQGVSRTASFRGLEGRALSVGRKALKSTKTLKGDVVSRSGVAARQVGDDVWVGFGKSQSQNLKKVVRPGRMIQFNYEGLGRDAPRLSLSTFNRGSGRSVLLKEVSNYIPSGRGRVTTESRFLTRVLDSVDDVGAVGSGGGVSRSVGGGGGSVLQAKLDSVGLIQRSPPKTSDLSGLVSEVLERSSKSVSQSQADIGFTQSLAGGLAAFASRKPKTTGKQQVKTALPTALGKPPEQEGLYSPTSLMKPTSQDGGGVYDLDVMPSLSTLQETGGGLMQIHKPRMESVSRVSQAPRRLTSPSSDLVRGDLSKPIRELSPVLALEAGLTSGLVSDSGLKPFSPGVPPAPMSGISGVPPGLIPGFGPRSGYGGGGFNFERFWKIENPLSIPDLEGGKKKRRRKKENGFGFF